MHRPRHRGPARPPRPRCATTSPNAPSKVRPDRGTQETRRLVSMVYGRSHPSDPCKSSSRSGRCRPRAPQSGSDRDPDADREDPRSRGPPGPQLIAADRLQHSPISVQGVSRMPRVRHSASLACQARARRHGRRGCPAAPRPSAVVLSAASRRSRPSEVRCDVGTAGYPEGMVDPGLVEQATSLSVDERLELIGAVWDSIDHSTRPVSPAVTALIEERVADARANPLDGRSWGEVRESLRQLRGR